MTEKKIVYTNPVEFIFLLIINCGIAVACIWTGNIWGFVFFGVCALYVVYPLLDPRKKVFFVGTKAYKEQIKNEFKNKLVDHGIFRYSQAGFTIALSPSKDIHWSEIQSIFAYKVDLMTIDQICMDVFCDHEILFRVTEETPGWFVFLERLQEQFPSIEKDWNIKVMHPAFETNLTLIYDRENRAQEQVSEIIYNKSWRVVSGPSSPPERKLFSSLRVDPLQE